jgi:hypothetical protein
MDIETNHPVIQPSKPNKSIKIILAALAILLLFTLGALAPFGYYKYKSLKMTAQRNTVQQKTGENEIAENQPTEPLKINILTGSILKIKKGDIEWQEPEDIGDLGLTTKADYLGDSDFSQGVKYVKVGKIINWDYTGSDVIDVVSRISEGPSYYPSIFRAFYNRDKNEMFFIDVTDSYNQDNLNRYFTAGKISVSIDNRFKLSELDFPDEIAADSREKFVRDEYTNSFFYTDYLKKAFVHPIYGQAWMTDISKINNNKLGRIELNSYHGIIDQSNKKTKAYDSGPFKSGGFYFRASDGTVVTYKLVLDIFDKYDRTGVLQANWADGTRNNVEYEEFPSGCGQGSYVYDKTNKTRMSDLVLIGKSVKGDDLFGYKNIKVAEFNKFYEEYYSPNNYYSPDKNGASSGSVPEEGKEAVLKKHPVVLWRDPFGRLLAFYRADLIPLAECGKPVIYLYPEKPMKVSIKIEPKWGLSISIPEYIDGWNVFSDESSHITNLADGKTYPYLFWEGSSDVLYETPNQGFVVARGNLDEFLSDKLAKLGLIEKESRDFKEFWIPKMLETEKPFYFVTFNSRNLMDKIAPLDVNPEPQTVIRILMDYYGMDEYKNVPELKIKTPERKGFTVVEWGGVLK